MRNYVTALPLAMLIAARATCIAAVIAILMARGPLIPVGKSCAQAARTGFASRVLGDLERSSAGSGSSWVRGARTQAFK